MQLFSLFCLLNIFFVPLSKILTDRKWESKPRKIKQGLEPVFYVSLKFGVIIIIWLSYTREGFRQLT